MPVPQRSVVLLSRVGREMRVHNAGALMRSLMSGIRTMVVDDSPAALRAICSVVERQANLVFVGAATNGREGLALARSLRPDLVLLDLAMPIMGGIEAASCLQRDCPATRVVIVTVHDTPELRKLCYERGAGGFSQETSCTTSCRLSSGNFLVMATES